MPKSPNSLAEIALLFARLGATAFGGPLAHIALMEAEFVSKRGWLSRQEFLDLLGAVNLIPGPNSTELAMHIGHKRGGFAGLWVAGAAFIAPAMALVLVLAALYHRFGALPSSRAILWGVAPVVVAIVAQALLRFAPDALKNWASRAIALAALIGLALGLQEIALIFGAAILGLLTSFFIKTEPPKTPTEIAPKTESQMPFLLLTGALPVAATAWGVFWAFLKMGCVVYGSGYVLLAYLRAELVENRGWITTQQLLDAVAIGQVTPGPVFTTATFIGYQIAGFWGGLAATAGIFGPSFIFVGFLAAGLEKLKNSPRLRVFLDFVNAASFALMAVVTGQLAKAALFPENRLDFAALLMGAAALVLLARTKLNPAWILGGGAVLGLVLRH